MALLSRKAKIITILSSVIVIGLALFIYFHFFFVYSTGVNAGEINYFQQEGIQSKMILQVHDELNFDVIPSELDRVQRIVIEEMEGVYHGEVKLTASHGAASNWLDAH